MTQHVSTGPASPVRVALFPDGPDLLLLNPDISESRWRGERVRAGLRPRIVLAGLTGVVLAVLSASSTTGFAAVFALGAGTLAVGASAFAGWRNATRVLTDHRHGPGSPCRLDRVRGEFFLRSRDLAEAGTAAARTLIAGVDELHRSPARAWIDPALLREVHRVVWETFCCLDRTRPARSLADDLAADPDSEAGELAAAARQAVDVIDDSLGEVVRHVDACLVLTRAWEAKLRQRELAALTDRTLAVLPGHAQTRRVAEAAEALPRAIFAHITAARDVTGAGAFPWEQPPSSWPQGRHALLHHGGTSLRGARSDEGLS
ncbi:hypothetical protein SAMN05216266_13314 [Amycolatopsis marina]|uniref:Uncharacterized protein n=1 Tax=Amycolatopsis marina TaxID=490629 RepID=A0A1I1CK50_9PSEU|nr:hypothetical protein [Amycolatopsis marina]SFB63069.1 hypothetical protein SAMN05216266_13314 [Amycolatopsis marina]